jgi:hypothetical protein
MICQHVPECPCPNGQDKLTEGAIALAILKHLIENQVIGSIYHNGKDSFRMYDGGCGCCAGDVDIPVEMANLLFSLGASS